MKTFKFFLPIILGGILFSCSHHNDPSDNKLPRNLISYEKAFEQLRNYNAAHPGVKGDQYALRTWVSIEDLENYIAYVKSEGKKYGIEVNGIEFIHTQYQSAEPYLPNHSNVDYELTFMYAPTFKDASSGKNEAFDPMNSKKDKPLKLREVFEKKEKKDSIDTDLDSEDKSHKLYKEKSGIANSLNTCPNICP